MTTLAVGNARLLKLADFLDQLPREHLAMDSWFSVKGWERMWSDPTTTTDKLRAAFPILNDKKALMGIAPERIAECGFAACAVGWAAQIPAFKRAGFRLQLDVSAPCPEYDTDSDYATGWAAVEAFFHLGYRDDDSDFDSEEAFYLFDDALYDTGDAQSIAPTMVADRIRKFVADRTRTKAK